MKRRIFVIALAFAAVTAAVGTTVASLIPNEDVITAVYVRVNENSATPLKFVGNFDITPGANQLIVDIEDTRTTESPDTRKAYAANGTTLLTTSGSAHISAGTITIP